MERIRGLYRRAIQQETRQELEALFKLAWPVSVLCIFEILVQFITLIFCGHLKEDVFAGVCLAVSYINITAVAIGNGLGTAVDTLVSQTFGAKNNRRVGIIVQTSILIFGTFCFPIWGLWLNAEYITSFIAQDPHAAVVAGSYMDIYLPALPAIFLFTILSKYMENQEIVKPLIVSGAFTSVMSLIYNGVLIFGCGFGYKGAAFAGALGNYTLALSTLGLIWWKGLHCDTWKGWSKECLLHWGLFYKLAIPGLFMLCIEWWTFQAGTMVMSILGDTVLNAQGIMFQIVTTIFGAAYGLSVAACARVGIFLGSGQPAKAKFVTRLSFYVMLACAVTVATIFLAFSSILGYAFTSDSGVIKLFHKLLLLYFGVIIYFDWFQVVAQGVFRGCGYQNVGAIINNVTLILIALPLGISLALKTSLTAVGYWLGILVGLILQFFSYFVMIYRMNWEKESDVARNRAGVTKEESFPLLKGGALPDPEYECGEGSSGCTPTSGYGGVDARHDKKENEESVEIPINTILSRLGILSVSLFVFIACLVFRIRTVG